MTCDYQKIRQDNTLYYGTGVSEYGPKLLADRYADKNHFIYELLQNAEDALARLGTKSVSRSVRFELSRKELRFSHSGIPFDEDDVRGICNIGQSTKGHTSIGRFGIGFKSVYAYTKRPRVHSDSEHFAIEHLVLPVAVDAEQPATGKTVIVMPLRKPTDYEEIHAGLQRIGHRVLLFLREIEKIEWNAGGRLSGLYNRRSEELDDCVRRVTVTGLVAGQSDIEEIWQIFSKPVCTPEGKFAGYVEVAFLLSSESKEVLRVSKSPLTVFFPTEVETHLGFLVQGPYRTTPTRDNVTHPDDWNQHCVKETANTLINALIWLRDNQLLDVNVLRCLPLEQEKFEEQTMFAPLYEGVKQALSSRPLLPKFNGGYVRASRAKLARTQELRTLFKSKQLTKALLSDSKLDWLSDKISQDRTPELREYLMYVLDIREITPETILRNLDTKFMDAQTNNWVLRFYEFLKDQPAQKEQARKIPLLRLTDGRHTSAYASAGQPQVFLPGGTKTGFSTIHPAVCGSEEAQAFLRSLGLTEPKLVDDVMLNILPKYANEHDIEDATYDADISRILKAFATDSTVQRKKLVDALCETCFVRAVNAGDGSICYSRPKDLYLATDQMKDLFDGIAGVKLVNDSCASLIGEDVRKLLATCGARRYLQITREPKWAHHWEAKFKELRRESGHEKTSGRNDVVTERKIYGLENLLKTLPELSIKDRQKRASLLWQELVSLAIYQDDFYDIYTWTHNGTYEKPHEATFVRQLNESKWVPDDQGELHQPSQIFFKSLNWEPNAFLESKIHFRPPTLEQLAEESGIEPAALDLLKEQGIYTKRGLEELLKRAGIMKDPSHKSDDGLGELIEDKPDGSKENGKSTGVHKSKKKFISYVVVTNDKEHTDGSNREKMDLEKEAIKFIRKKEPKWKRTKRNNPGFDLYQEGSDGKPIRWCEVKAMKSSFNDHPAELSRTQFEYAQKHGKKYWLYVVEHAGDKNANILRIQDPAGKARTFTFDHGWREIAQEVD